MDSTSMTVYEEFGRSLFNLLASTKVVFDSVISLITSVFILGVTFCVTFCRILLALQGKQQSGEEAVLTIRKALQAPRSVNIKIKFEKPIWEMNSQDVNLLKKAVAKHGSVCLVNALCKPEQLRDFAKKWGPVLTLPPGLAFNNQVPMVPECARVGNVRLDGTVMKKHSAAEYWHHDGDFWQPGSNQILNFLCAVKVPRLGGNTGFLDTRKGFLLLSDEEKRSLEGSYSIVRASGIDDFASLPVEEQPPDARHPIIARHPVTGTKSLYLPFTTTGIQKRENGKVVQIGVAEHFKKKLEKAPGLMTEHKWSVGDLLIWDNTTTMHRSMGGYFDDARLLYRVQARINKGRAWTI